MRYRRLVQPGATYFFTLVLHARANLFADSGNVAHWCAAVTKVRSKRPFDVEAEVILPDHLHMLWTLPDGDGDFPTRIRLAKSYFTRSLVDIATPPSRNQSRRDKGERDVWQRRYWEHLIADDRDFLEHLDYVHYNPVKHGHAKSPAEWPYSTFKAWVARGAYEPYWGADKVPPMPKWPSSDPQSE